MAKPARWLRTLKRWCVGGKSSRHTSARPRLASTPVFDPTAPLPVPSDLRIAEAEWLAAKHDSPDLTPQDRIAMFQRFNAEADREIRKLEAELADLMRQERTYR